MLANELRSQAVTASEGLPVLARHEIGIALSTDETRRLNTLRTNAVDLATLLADIDATASEYFEHD